MKNVDFVYSHFHRLEGKGKTQAEVELDTDETITAFVLVFPPLDEDDKYMVLPYFWIPEENMHQRVRRDRVPYGIWEQQGFIKQLRTL